MDKLKVMLAAGVEPNVIIYKEIIKACAQGNMLCESCLLFEQALESDLTAVGFDLHPTLMEAYRAAGDRAGAERVQQLMNAEVLNHARLSATSNVDMA